MSIEKLIEAIEKKKPLPEFSILCAIQMLDVVWGKVTTKTVVKARISKEKQSEALLDAHDTFKNLPEQSDKLAVYNPKFFAEGTTVNDIVSGDDSLTSIVDCLHDLMRRLEWRRFWRRRWHRWCF